MKYRQLGSNGPKVSALGLGCMGMSAFYGPSDEEMAIRVIHYAFTEGVNLFDTAAMYGNGENEILLAKALRGIRNQVLISTKCGIEWDGVKLHVDNHPEYIRKSCEESLKRLGTEVIDIFFLHRYNPETPIEMSMQAMLTLIQEGKIRYVGLSEVKGDILGRAHAILGDKLVALQSEYSIANHAAAEKVLPTCRKLRIGFMAYSPILRGLLTGKLKDAQAFSKSGAFDVRSIAPQFQSGTFEENLRLVAALEVIAKRKKCTLAQLSLAWLLAQGEDIIPIPGTKRVEYLRENVSAVDITLSDEDLKAIEQAEQTHPIQGQRLA